MGFRLTEQATARLPRMQPRAGSGFDSARRGPRPGRPLRRGTYQNSRQLVKVVTGSHGQCFLDRGPFRVSVRYSNRRWEEVAGQCQDGFASKKEPHSQKITDCGYPLYVQVSQKIVSESTTEQE